MKAAQFRAAIQRSFGILTYGSSLKITSTKDTSDRNVSSGSEIGRKIIEAMINLVRFDSPYIIRIVINIYITSSNMQ